SRHARPLDLHSFPTRRSSDLSPVGLAAAVGNAGGLGALGALMTSPDGIAGWAQQFRGQSNGTFQINLWVPDPEPVRDAEHEMRRSEEHTSELQSRGHLVCRLL